MGVKGGGGGGGGDYTYLLIKDAICSINQKVNLMGVIVEFRDPQKSKGTDYFCTLKIMDDSYQSPGLLITIFAENIEKLPNVKSVGDIIRLSRVVMNAHQGKVNANFHKKYSSFALYEGRSWNNFIPYQAPANFHPNISDKDFITRLRTWFLGYQADAGTNESMTLLREMKEGECFNLACKILHVCEASKTLFVWDGSDAPPLSCLQRLSEEHENPLPLQLGPSPLPRDVLCTFPRVGTVLRVRAQEARQLCGLHLVHGGVWVKFINMVCQVRSGLWYGVLVPSSKLQILSRDDIAAKSCKRIYNKRISSLWDRMPFSTFPWPSHITGLIFSPMKGFLSSFSETDREDLPFVTLMYSLTNTEVVGIFKCVVRVVAIYPWQVEDFRSPLDKRLYRVRLTLEDPTARIHAFIYAEDGKPQHPCQEKFFDGYPSMDVLTRKCNKLLGITEVDPTKEDSAPRNPPWVQCCLRYHYVNEDDPWGSRKYRIIDTKLVV